MFFFIFGLFLLNSENKLSNSIKSLFSDSFKETLRNTIFYVPVKFRELENAQKKIIELDLTLRKQNKELDVLKSKINSGSKTILKIYDELNNEYILEKFFLDFSVPPNSNKKNKKNGYLEVYKNNIITILWSGKIMYLNKNDLIDDFVKFKNIQTNISNFLKYDEDKFVSIKDAMILENKLYLTYTKNINPSNNCLNLSIVDADIFELNGKISLSKFEEFFTYEECKEARFNGYQSGGRLYEYKDNNILLTIGDFQNFTPAQDKKSLFGKIISINTNTKEYRLVSMGHRNQQGLLYEKDKDIIISTEHGQEGGDEINIIIDKKNGPISNYGWPIASYSEYYGYENSEIKKIAPFKKPHKKFGFIEPLIYFTPALGISQIVDSSNFKYDSNENVYLVSSMKQKKIVFIQIDKDKKKAKKINELYIGERIRDIIKLDKNYYLLYLENSPAIGLLSIK